MLTLSSFDFRVRFLALLLVTALDLFAFTIKMPTLHRLATLRDDVIFFIYLYQSYKYRVDYSRVNEFGQGGDEGDGEGQGEEKKEQEGDNTANNDDEQRGSADAATAVEGDSTEVVQDAATPAGSITDDASTTGISGGVSGQVSKRK